MSRPPLFRVAALEAQRASPLGEIVLAPPLTSTVLAAVAGIAAAAIAAFFHWGTYTAHTAVTGQLVATPAVVKLYSPQPGVIAERHVEEGDRVRVGQLLYVVTSDRLSSGFVATREAVAAELERRLRSLEAERAGVRELERTERAALERSIAALRAEVAEAAAMLAAQNARAALAEEHAARYAELHAGGFVSLEQLLAREQEAAEHSLQSQRLERERRQSERLLGERTAELETLAARHRARLAELDRALAGVRQERAENEARRSVLVVAPTAGVATGVGADVGEATDGSRPLVSIVPHGARLHAELYAPSRAIGFVGAGDTVLLRYRAYPYQKFGHHRGTVRSVSRVAFSASELGGASPAAAASAEPLYRLEVELPAQAIHAHGEAHALQAGMLVDADVLGETRRLYEWVLEPLYSLRR